MATRATESRAGERRTAWLSRGLEALVDERRDLASPDRTPGDGFDFDLVIVGSGYGAAVAAVEFSGCKFEGKAISICVLERGKEYLAGSFPSGQSDLPGHIRFTTPNANRQAGRHDGLFDVRASPDAIGVVASGLGGGSLVNAGVMAMPLASVLSEGAWPSEIRRDAQRIIADGDILRNWLGAHPFKAADEPLKTGLVRTLAGWRADAPGALRPFRELPVQVASKAGPNSAGVALDACIRCGDCATGCNHNAKDSLDLNLLKIAHDRGVRLVTGAAVLRVRVLDLKLGGWIVELNHTDKHLRDRQPEPFRLRARWVILAAGTFGSTEILMRSKGTDDASKLALSEKLGRQVSANGDVLALAYDLERRANAIAREEQPADARNVGPTITAMVDLRTGDPDTDVVIQDLAIPGALRRLFEESSTTSDIVNGIARGDWRKHGTAQPSDDDAAVDPDRIDASLPLAMIVRDSADGSLVANGPIADNAEGMLTLKWPEYKSDPRFDHAHDRLAKRIAEFGLGARVIRNIFWRPLSDELEQIFGQQRGPLLTVHPLGGAPMGEDVRAGVTDHCGRVFNAGKFGNPDHALYPGLAVLDGSIIPTSLGINPALTIAAVALRAVEGLKRSWRVEGGSFLRPSDHVRASTKTPGTPARAEDAAPANHSGPLPEPAHVTAQPEGGIRRPVYTVAAPATKARETRIELTEQMRGPVAIWTPYGSVTCTLEITLTTAPASVADLIAKDSTNRHFRVPAGGGKLRLLKGEPDPVADDWSEDNVVLEADLSGTITLFPLDRSGWITRALRAFPAWFLNRGLRDIFQRLRRDRLEDLRVLPSSGLKRQGFIQYAKGMLRLLTRAGAVRLLNYEFKVERVTGGSFDPVIPEGREVQPDPASWLRVADFEGRRICGEKRLTYERASSPIHQLMEITLRECPGAAMPRSRRKQPTLFLNQRYLSRIAIPLFRIVDQEDHVAGLTDLASFGLYALRVIVQTHTLSFRKPDPPAQRQARMFCGAIAGLEAPEIHWLSLKNPPRDDAKATAFARLARYRRPDCSDGNGRPVLLIHGYSAGGTIFAHPSVPGNLAETLCAAGRDVWVIDLRSSAAMDTAKEPWRFEDMADLDIPAATDHIREATRSRKVDVVAHCMGAAMFSMALLAERDVKKQPNRLHEKIGRVVFCQVGPVMIMSPANLLRGYLMRYVQRLLSFEDYEFSPQGKISVMGQLLDRGLSALGVPSEEFRRENPLWPLGASTPWVGTRHRIDALYARTFSLRNLSDDVLDHIDDFLGPLSVATASQAVHFMQFNTVTTANGSNAYVSTGRLKKRLCFPILSLHGDENGLIDVGTLDLMRRSLHAAGHTYLNEGTDDEPTRVSQTEGEMLGLIEANRGAIGGREPTFLTWRIAGHGHLDPLIGVHAGMVSRVVSKFLGVPDQ